ncbi:[Fe-Fe] hydrogenase large subunit C-terminal domain-containing protein [Clostridiaceae bacterium M8S5]|nr:[Fe-Fe] hydrogenase large subunit C-terminal domain-containing protein [Clostridiaceae bacterium M8S5]
MSLIHFSKDKCNHCYRCLRACETKAIKILDEVAKIEDELCIACGLCYTVCPQQAISINNYVQEVKEAIEDNKKVIVSIAPSFPGAFDMEEIGQIVTGLKRLGIEIVEETSIGAEIIIDYYKKYIEEGKQKNLISTSCPAGNYLIEKYYPSLIEYMIPVVSPMIAHGKMLKSKYGMDAYVVFIGPCIAKRYESQDFEHEGAIDSVLTFDELAKWFQTENIVLKELEPQKFDKKSSKRGNLFPISGNIFPYNKDTKNSKYDFITVNDIKDCKEVLSYLESGSIDSLCVELNICNGSCIGGPGMPKDGSNYYSRYKRVKEYVSNTEAINRHEEEYKDLNYHKTFFDKKVDRKMPNEEEIKKILGKIGKYTESDELNCNACGYQTCREKAESVYEGMTELNMCLPYMKAQADSLKNVIFKYSPNAIFLLDNNLFVKEFNPTAERLFNIDSRNIVGKPISFILNDEDFVKVMDTKESLIKEKRYYSQYGVTMFANILYLEEEHVILAIMTDITKNEKDKKELARVKANTLNAAQEVINKQMRVAQEIASLLGETTAETKMILTKLKDML